MQKIFKNIFHQKGPIASRLAKIAIDEGAQVEMGSALLIEQQCYAQVAFFNFY
jgi:methylglutaconyl-CoA hydratase